MIILETDRLILRTWELTDEDAGFAIWGDKEVVKYIPTAEVLAREQVVASIKRGIDHQIKYGYQHWAVVLKENQRLIGACGFNHLDDESENGLSRADAITIELSFHFQRSFWGNGYASEAAEACIAYAKEKLDVKRIVAGVNRQNVRSVRILEKLDFNYMGLVYFDDTKTFEPMFERYLHIDA